MGLLKKGIIATLTIVAGGGWGGGVGRGVGSEKCMYFLKWEEIVKFMRRGGRYTVLSSWGAYQELSGGRRRSGEVIHTGLVHSLKALDKQRMWMAVERG